jgi:hypothetical protein
MILRKLDCHPDFPLVYSLSVMSCNELIASIPWRMLRGTVNGQGLSETTISRDAIQPISL